MDRVDVSRPMAAPASRVGPLFWDITAWHRVWEPISEVAVLYEDPVHQEFTMAVERNGRIERIRTVRFRTTGHDMEFFTPQPPPMMSWHRGAWLIQDAPGGGCTVRATRDYRLRDEPGESAAAFGARRARFGQSFEIRVGAILDRFADHFSRKEQAHAGQ
ncbi:SRPBCC family protein [Streptomyces flavofungini]|uniref:SRPBCC family protein n=1 Tax=Streptomyces flavofungini TaxID=68200 RepID=A0ABS0XGN3_9ACTN|nr:SRPBCC family protein [Streptomyces flavofungini]MBJ3812379.1 SRPBCC family protein [Streptomyces flavofungini]GHC88097.1 hypothetical protein GCM10010349_75110 [Streptomyces flavofungini]